MGKKNKSFRYSSVETVSNQDINHDEGEYEAINMDVFMPAALGAEPEFLSDLLPKLDEKREIALKSFGDITYKNDYPSKCICLLIITGADNRTYYGTGFIISERCVITAGHCLHFGRGWAKQIKIFPGANGMSTPYGGDISSKFFSTNKWTQNRAREFDFGAIILSSNQLFDNVNAYMAYREIALPGHLLLGGYPINKNLMQVTLQGKTTEVKEFVITYDLQTVEGTSGSPVYTIIDNQIIVIALHTFGGNPNFGIRITDKVISYWLEWIKSAQQIV